MSDVADVQLSIDVLLKRYGCIRNLLRICKSCIVLHDVVSETAKDTLLVGRQVELEVLCASIAPLSSLHHDCIWELKGIISQLRQHGYKEHLEEQ